MNRAALYNLINQNFPDNNLRLVTAAKARQVLTAMVANMFVLAEDVVGAEGTFETVTQPDHGFTAPMAIRESGTGWVKSVGLFDTELNSSDPAEVYGIVTKLIDANTFQMCTGGKFDSTGMNLQAGKVYFLSSATPGVLTLTPPDQENQIVKALVLGGRNNTAYFVNFVGEVLGAGGSTSPGGGDITVDQEVTNGSANPVSGEAVWEHTRYAPADDDEELGYFAGLLDGALETSLKQAIDRIVSYSNRYIRIGHGKVADRWAKIQSFFGQDIPTDSTVYPVTNFFFHNPTAKALRHKYIFTGTGSDQATHGTDGKVILYVPIYDENEENQFVEVTIDGKRLTNADVEQISGRDYWKMELPTEKLYSFSMIQDRNNTQGQFNLIVSLSSDLLNAFADQRVDGVKTFLKTLELEGSFPVFRKVAYYDPVAEAQYLPSEFYLDFQDLTYTGTYNGPAIVSITGGGANYGINFSYNGEYFAGFNFGIGASNDKGSFVGAQLIFPLYGRPDQSKGLRFFIGEDATSDVALYTTPGGSQRLASMPITGASENTDTTVNVVMSLFTHGRRRVFWNGNISFNITEPIENHEFLFAVRTGASGAVLNLPAFSFLTDGQSTTLAANSYYEVAVRCFSDQDAVKYKWSIVKQSVNNAGTTPAVPSIKKLIAQKNSLTVIIAPVAGATGYRVDVATDSGFTNILPAYTNFLMTGLSAAILTLTADTMYYVRIRAFNGAGTSANSSTQSIRTLTFEN